MVGLAGAAAQGAIRLDKQQLESWVGGYVRAWEANDPDDIGRLFTEDALYFAAPHREPWRGREEIVAGWLDRKDEPGTWTFAHEIIAVCDGIGFVQGRTDYAPTSDGPAQAYSNLWVIRLDAAGRCMAFTEWWMQQP